MSERFGRRVPTGSGLFRSLRGRLLGCQCRSGASPGGAVQGGAARTQLTELGSPHGPRSFHSVYGSLAAALLRAPLLPGGAETGQQGEEGTPETLLKL